jgi:hypothetical protein
MSDDVFHSTQICMDRKWNIVRHDEEGYIYAYYDRNWVSYDDVRTVITKVSSNTHTTHTSYF